MNLSETGELGFIEIVRRKFSKSTEAGVLGIGDDCAVIDQKNGWSTLVTTDLLTENVHFVFDAVTPQDLGFKSLAVNLSDVAAMGGAPSHFFLSIALPAKVTTLKTSEWIDPFLESMAALADDQGISLLGGDTTASSGGLTISITLLGKVENQWLKTRSGAKVGDVICVSGALGDSSAGLKILLEGRKRSQIDKILLERHLRPPIRVKQAQWLARQQGVHSMIDLSDGLDSDIRRIIEASSKGAPMSAVIHLDRLPLSSELARFCQEEKLTAYEMAAIGGEDYELLFTISETRFAEINEGYQQQFHESFFEIGKIVDAPLGLSYLHRGELTVLKNQGFRHF